MAEVDAEGNVNVSRFVPKLAGPGGFVNISQNARSVWFLGTFTAGAQVGVGDGLLRVVADTAVRRFVRRVQQRTFSGAYARRRGQQVHYVTERATFRLTGAGLAGSKVAYTFALASGKLQVMAAGMVAPPALALATVVRPKPFTDPERKAGEAAWLLGASFITEGVAPWPDQSPVGLAARPLVGSTWRQACQRRLWSGHRQQPVDTDST
jgi:hypothetical protein